MPVGNYDDEDDIKEAAAGRTYKEFDCPSCSANNPVDKALEDADEIRCNYCGDEFKVKMLDDGRMRLKEA